MSENDSPPDKSAEPASLDNNYSGILNTFSDVLTTLWKELARPDASLPEKVLLAVLFLTPLTGVTFATIFLIGGQWASILYTVGATIGALFLLAVGALYKVEFAPPLQGVETRQATLKSAKVPSQAKIVWQRIVPNWTFSEDHLTMLRKELDAVRLEAYDRILKRGHQLSIDEIRANIFFPFYSNVAASSGNIFELKIVNGLSINMDSHRDEKVIFRPGQGLTGIVFVKQEPRFAIAIEGDDGQRTWDEKYELTEDQKELIHPRLRWISSFPLMLMDDGTKRAAAVLNVDGLDSVVTVEDLADLNAQLLSSIARIADKLNELDMVRVCISVEDLDNG